MTKRIERDDMECDTSAHQQDENDDTPVTTIWKWNTPEEASAFLDGMYSVGDDALTGWIDDEDPSTVLICEHEAIYDFDGCPRVHYGGE